MRYTRQKKYLDGLFDGEYEWLLDLENEDPVLICTNKISTFKTMRKEVVTFNFM